MTPVSDLSATYKSLADQYYTYINTGNFTSAQQLLTDNPTLETMIINAKKINKYQNIALALERFFKDDVETYLETRFAYIGTYASGTTYVKGNIVDFGGEGFICRVISSMGVSPTAHSTTENWAIISQQGIQGVSGTGLSPRGVWNVTTNYYVDDCVADNNTLWQCLVANIDSEPTSSNTNWISLLGLNITWDNLIGKPSSYPPSYHASTHKTGGNDPLVPGDIGAETAFSKNTAFNKSFETSNSNMHKASSAFVGSSSNIARADHVHPAEFPLTEGSYTSSTEQTSIAYSFDTPTGGEYLLKITLMGRQVTSLYALGYGVFIFVNQKSFNINSDISDLALLSKKFDGSFSASISGSQISISYTGATSYYFTVNYKFIAI